MQTPQIVELKIRRVHNVYHGEIVFCYHSGGQAAPITDKIITLASHPDFDSCIAFLQKKMYKWVRNGAEVIK